MTWTSKDIFCAIVTAGCLGPFGGRDRKRIGARARAPKVACLARQSRRRPSARVGGEDRAVWALALAETWNRAPTKLSAELGRGKQENTAGGGAFFIQLRRRSGGRAHRFGPRDGPMPLADFERVKDH